MHAEWDYEADGIQYESTDEARRQYRQSRVPKLLRKKKIKSKSSQPTMGINRRRNKHWQW